MGKVCECCGRELKEDSTVCAVCGYDSTAVSDDGLTAEVRAAIHRRSVVSEVGDIGVMCYTYGNTGSGFGKKSAEKLRICSGVECLCKAVWTDRSFGVGPDPSKPRTVQFSIEYKGTEGIMELEVDMNDMPSPYKIGAMISEDLVMHFYIGLPEDNMEFAGGFLPEDE